MSAHAGERPSLPVDDPGERLRSKPSPDYRRSILVAPDSFKGTFTAEQVAAAIGTGVRAAGWEADLCPVADGGEGTASALLRAHGGRLLDVPTTDALGRSIRGKVALLGSGRVAVVEVASASGLSLLSSEERDVIRASTWGTGLEIIAALDRGARDILVAAGGSATVDYGRGALAAVRGLGGLRGASLTVLCDVQTSWEDCARVFGPQKGAGQQQIRELEGCSATDAESLSRDPRGVPMGGAAGGLAGALWAAFDARLVAGAAHVLQAVKFDERLGDANAVITGEGRIDSQSAMGKIVGEIGKRAAAAGVPAHAIGGTVGLTGDESIPGLVSIRAASTLEQLSSAAGELASELRANAGRGVEAALARLPVTPGPGGCPTEHLG